MKRFKLVRVASTGKYTTCTIHPMGLGEVKRASTAVRAVVEANKRRMEAEFPKEIYAILELGKEP